MLSVLEPSYRPTEGLRLFDYTLIAAIIASIVIFCTLTLQNLPPAFVSALNAIDLILLIAFAVEYTLRIWSCTADSRYAHPILGRIRYAIRPAMIIDLIVILPLLLMPLEWVMPGNFVVLRLLRLLRLARFAKLGRYSKSIQVMGAVLKRSIHDIAAIMTVLLMLLVISASLIYYAERDAQPEAFSSIPAAMWWAVATLTTVGYGDIYPITALGRLLAAISAILGIGFIALPTGMLSAAYLDELRAARTNRSPPDQTDRPSTEPENTGAKT